MWLVFLAALLDERSIRGERAGGILGVASLP
jgi:hypothetical protein